MLQCNNLMNNNELLNFNTMDLLLLQDNQFTEKIFEDSLTVQLE